MAALADRIATWLADQTSRAGASGLAVGMSGGIDSAVVARLCQMARPDGVLGVILPCHSDPRDETDARLAADHFGIRTVTIPLDRTCTTLVEALAGAPAAADDRARLAFANLKPRLRMTALYFVANRLNYLVAGTGNRSELAMGYFTKYGDGGVDLLPIGDLLKREVVELARELDVPESVRLRVPSAGLWLGQTDEEELGFSYDLLEAFLETGPDAVPPPAVARMERLARAGEHKRRLPPIFRKAQDCAS